MKKYIFITAEGDTTAPNSLCIVNNMQVIGIIEGVNNVDEAKHKLLDENKWIINAGFNTQSFIAYEIV
ncbi:hypothetical protein [Flavobacterium coralii]|uniref:hypothetical protein n=1 Tax=Flavobacterium coralii TaxID=2838017 RepID=UPI000C3A1C4E|nr:hypothetical protein [Flavobacterium sp.]|tara:strand:- start:34 stop:237 length:204 start_codon:yes stop_codon:yes gene_type:complete